MSSTNPTTTTKAPEETPVATGPAQEPRAKSRRRPGPPLFTGDDPPPGPDSPTSPGPEQGPLGDAGSTESATPPETGHDPKPPSGGRSSRGPFSRAELRRAIAGGVTGVSYLAAENLHRDDVDEQLDRFIATADEATNLADPLANLAARRMNGPAGMLNPDLVDVVNALVVVATYVTRQLRLRSIARRIRRGETPMPATDSDTLAEPGLREPAAV